MSSGVTKKSMGMASPDGKWSSSVMTWVIVWLEVPSNSCRRIGETGLRGRECNSAKPESMKQWEEPESISVRINSLTPSENRSSRREFGSERADALSRRTVAVREESTQSSHCAGFGGLRTIFLARSWSPRPRESWPGQRELSRQTKTSSSSRALYVRSLHRRGRGC